MPGVNAPKEAAVFRRTRPVTPDLRRLALPETMQSASPKPQAAPVSIDPVTIGFTQHAAPTISGTGTYTQTLTFLLSTTSLVTGPARGGRAPSGHGVVVDSVNVSVLQYVPVRSASLAPIGCLNSSVTASLETGPCRSAGSAARADGADVGTPCRCWRCCAHGPAAAAAGERAVDQVAGRGRARVGDRQRRVARGRDHVRRRRARCSPSRRPG